MKENIKKVWKEKNGTMREIKSGDRKEFMKY